MENKLVGITSYQSSDEMGTSNLLSMGFQRHLSYFGVNYPLQAFCTLAMLVRTYFYILLPWPLVMGILILSNTLIYIP